MEHAIPSRPSGPLGFAWTRADTVALAFVVAGLAAIFFSLLTPARAPFFRDIGPEIVPKKTFQARSGTQVLWNPLIGFGQPLAANPQEAAFYPPGLLFRVFDVASALGPYIFLHLLAAAVLVFVLARSRAASPAAAAFAALAFAAGGFVASCGNQVVMLNSVVWLPGLVWALGRAVDDPRLAPVAGLFWALQVVGGEAEIATLSGLVAAVYLAGRLTGRDNARRAGAALGVALVFALGFSAVQLLLTLQYIPLSNRAAAFDAATAGAWSLAPARLVSLIAPEAVPDANGNLDWVLGFRGNQLPYILSIYAGLSCVLLAGLGAARHRSNLVLLIAALLFTWFALGPDGKLYFVLHAIPGFNRFRMPERCLLGAAFFLPLLAADGLDRLSALPAGRRTTVIGAALIAAAAAFAALRFFPAPGGDDLARHEQMLASALSRSWAISFLGLGIAALLLSRRDRLVAPLLVAALFLDLFVTHRHVIPTTDRRAFYSMAGSLAEAGDPSLRSVVLSSEAKRDGWIGVGQDPVDFYRRQRLRLGPFTAVELGITDCAALSSLFPAEQAIWYQLSRQVGVPILLLSGVEQVLDPNGKSERLKNPLPRAYTVNLAVSADNQKLAIETAIGQLFDPGRMVVVETPDPGPPGKGVELAPARITRSENQRVEIAATGPGWLVLLDAFYPGWKATVNGRPAEIVRANGFFRAVRIGPGPQTVIFGYRPWQFYAGAAVSLATLLLAAGASRAGLFARGRLIGRVWGPGEPGETA